MALVDRLLQFLKTSPLNVSSVEKEANMPARTLHRAIQSGTLPDKHLEVLHAVLSKYGFKEETSCKVIAVVNHKGGVGKTTTVINVGKGLTKFGHRVLLVDMDAQGNLSQCFNVHEPKNQVLDSLLDSKVPLAIEDVGENLFLSPSNFLLSYSELNIVTSIGADRKLKNVLANVKDQFDYVLIDCPPSAGIFTINCLMASDSCIIPLQPEASAYYGLQNLIQKIQEVKENGNNVLRVEGILFTMVNRITLHSQLIDATKEQLEGYRFFNQVIDNRVAIKQSQALKQDIFTYAESNSQAAVSAQQYLEIAKELNQH